MRRHAFDWRQVQDDRQFGWSDRQWIAPLENGHRLKVTRYGPGEGTAWTAHYHDGVEGEDTSPHMLPEDRDMHAAPNPERYPEHPKHEYHFWPTREEAMKGAQDAYKQKYPLGSDTGGHDSGVDYSDLNAFRDQL